MRLAVDPDVPPVRADAAQLERVFANLIENAVRYSGGQPVRCRRGGRSAGSCASSTRGRVRAGERERIFEPFYRGADQRPEPTRGSGLGLAIAQGFVEANGGRISVESLPGPGHELRGRAADRAARGAARARAAIPT